MSHSHLPQADVDERQDPVDPAVAAQRRRASVLLSLVLVPVALVTLIGLVLLWPSGDDPAVAAAAGSFTAPGTTFPEATVLSVEPFDCSGLATPAPGAPPLELTCARVTTRIDDGEDAGTSAIIELPPEIYAVGIEVGEKLKLQRTPGDGTTSASYSFNDFARQLPLTLLTIAFVVAVVAVARIRGAAAILGLGFAFVILVRFMLPGLLEGRSPILVALVGSSAIMFVVLYLAHGFTARTTTALTGTLFGLALTAGLGAWVASSARLTGLSSEESLLLTTAAGGISLSGLVLCGIIVAGLGVLNDVTITQASAVWQLHELSPALSARELFGSAMRIGRDHIASSVYTIVFAYAGAALPVLLLFALYARPLGDIITSEIVAEEIVRTLVGAIGLVLAVPVTTGVGVTIVKAAGSAKTQSMSR